MSADANEPAIGIDLGTTYCCVGYLAPNNHEVEIIDNEQGDRTTPSYVKFTDNGEIIGKPAKETTYRDPENVIYDSKRLIGRSFNDRCVQENIKNKIWTFNVSSDESDSPLININKNGRSSTYKPHEISAKLLGYMKNVAEQRIGKKVQNAVITVPAYFNYLQRTSTTEAAKLAGLNVLKIINEPTAAVLGYVHKTEVTNHENILVFDLGGGTFDVSVVSVKGTAVTVRATSGNTHLGGRDFDNNLANFIVEEIKNKYKIDVTNNQRKLRRIEGKSEYIKTKLSFQSTVFFDFPSFLDGDDVDIEITRAMFEKINLPLFERCINTVENCLKDAGTQKNEIEKILLVGGSTRIPKIQNMLSDFFNGRKELIRTINPDEAVAYGAAVQAAIFNKFEVYPVITDITPLSLGINTHGGKIDIVIPRNTIIPVTETKTYLTSEDKQTAMEIKIYEGERSLLRHNIMIGESKIEIPPRPPGYPVNISFHINENGILQVSATTGAGDYKNLTIKYKKQTVLDTSDILQDALEHKQDDDRKLTVLNKWLFLQNYCTKMKALSTYKTNEIDQKDRDSLTNIAEQTLSWTNNHEVITGSNEEKNSILDKQKEIEGVCEPTTIKYGYSLKDMNLLEFYSFITK